MERGGPAQGNVKDCAKLLIFGVSGEPKIRNTNIEIRNNIKIRISNDQNISETWTKLTGYGYVLTFGFMSFVFVSVFGFQASNLA